MDYNPSYLQFFNYFITLQPSSQKLKNSEKFTEIEYYILLQTLKKCYN